MSSSMKTVAATLMFLSPTLIVCADDPIAANKLSAKSFTQLQELIKPQYGESLWRHVPWETNLNAARRKAAQQGKPLLIWSGGGSAPLGGC